MGFEIPVDVDYFDHPKTKKMVALLGKRADVFPLRLWTWAAKFARNGIIDGGTKEIEEACRWDGKPGKLHEAMIASRVLEKDGVTIHDWMEHTGRQIKLYEKKKRNQRKRYQQTLDENLPSEPELESGRMEEECGNSSGRMEEEFRNSSYHNKKEQHSAEEQRKTKARELAQKAAFLRGFGTSTSENQKWYSHILDLMKLGISAGAIELELVRPDRLTSETCWDFQKRTMEKHGVNTKHKSGPHKSEVEMAAECKAKREAMGLKS